MEVVISFDDTGSMFSVRKQVRLKINELIKDLFNLDPKIRIGIIIHNDYCDSDTIQYLDLTNNKEKIIDFVNRGSSCGGGDSDECYELVLNHFHNKFSWKDDKKIAIIIGDCSPHNVGYKYGSFTNHLDWKEELAKCHANGIRVYPVQALNRRENNHFYDYIARIISTPKLDLSQFAHISQYITAIMYKEGDKLDDYENSQAEFKTNFALKGMFNKLKGISSKIESLSPGSYDLLSRFQVLNVEKSSVIRDFVEENGAEFKKGRGFYQLIYSELIQENKEVIFVDKLTGEVHWDTKWCRKQMGLPLGERGKVNPRGLECAKQYDIFVQSTSYNRKLDPNTKFLYELDYK